MPRPASMTDRKPDGRDVVGELLDRGPGEIVSSLTGSPANEYAPGQGLRGHVDSPRRFQRGRAAGVDDDVETHASCATCSTPSSTNPGKGEQLLDVSGDPRLAPGGPAEQEWDAKSARHGAGTWPRPDPVLVDVRDIREGRYGPAT